MYLGHGPQTLYEQQTVFVWGDEVEIEQQTVFVWGDEIKSEQYHNLLFQSNNPSSQRRLGSMLLRYFLERK
jgi:hypothetical protein